MKKYVDVILPLPLPKSFTYSLPDECAEDVKIGCRVVVPFGRKKFYTAIVLNVHYCAPTEYEVKDISALLDASPILLPVQFKFWEWIADYYLCTQGDVYKAALPSGLKLESETIVEYNPDLIIGTHSYAGVCISILADRAAFDCPSVGIVTDFTVHPFWESTFLDYYVIPDELLEHEMQKKGIAKKKLLPFGIPIREQFVKKNDPIEARKKLGIENIPTILIMMGSMGYGNIKKILAQIDTYPKDFQVLCVCGTNKKIKSVVDECEWNKKIYSYGFVDNVDVMMDAADFIITKPGGLTTSESLAKGLPMITMNPLPGQEDRNLNFLVNNGAAIMVNDTYPISEAINQMFACPWRVAMMEESVRHLGKPNATADLYNFCCAKVLAKSTLI